MAITIDGTSYPLPENEFQAQKVTNYNAVINALNTAWIIWTPSWTNLTIGNATVTGRYRQIGKLVHVRLNVVLGNTSSVTGDPTFTLPVTRVAYGGTAGITPLGSCALYDQSATTVYYGYVINLSTTTGAFRVSNTAGTYDTATSLSGTIPFTWTNPDEIAAVFTYEAA